MADRTQHTPGPWAVNPVGAVVDSFRATGEIVPVCALLWPTDVRSEDETEANARLIAAAPDLLAALKALVDVIDLHYPRDHFTVLTSARAAIAKAEAT